MTRLLFSLAGFGVAFTVGFLAACVIAGMALDPPGDTSMPGEPKR